MHIVLVLGNILVAALFLYIFYLETIVTDSQKTADTFGLSLDNLRNPFVQNQFKNQGVYNGLLAVGLAYAIISSNPLLLTRCIHSYIVSVASYGALTVNKSILLKQGGLSIIVLILSFILH